MRGDLLGGARDGVPVAARQEPAARAASRRWAGPASSASSFARLEPRAGAVEERLDLVLDAVRDLADARALLGRELAHAAEDRGELALLAEEADPELLERLLVRGARDRVAGALRRAPRAVARRSATPAS